MAVYYNDADPAACAWLRELIAAGHLPAGEVDQRSILEVDPGDLSGFAQCHFFAGIGGGAHALRLAGAPNDMPVWTGSPPCQPFSVAGQRKGQDDDRHLAPAFLRLVAACRPDLVFGEQVASAAVLGPVGGAARASVEGPAGWAWFDALAACWQALTELLGRTWVHASGQSMMLICTGSGVDVTGQELVLTGPGPAVDVLGQELVLDCSPAAIAVPGQDLVVEFLP